MYNRILLPLTGNDTTDHLLRHGISLAEKFDASIYTLFVIEPLPVSNNEATTIKESLQMGGEQLLNSIVSKRRVHKIPVHTGIESGDPYRIILDYVSHHNIDLIVISNHNRSDLEHTLLGSVTEKVIQRSPVPVLTVQTDREPRHGIVE